MIWMNRIFARVMSGLVVVPLRAAALPLHKLAESARCADIIGGPCVIAAATYGNVADVLSYLTADPNCVNECGGHGP
jgi:hypothetical protein